MAEAEEDILAAGAEIIWVLEAPSTFIGPANATACRETMDKLGSDKGWCVGDDQTRPEADTFDNSPFSLQRGFDMIVPTSTMEIVYTTTHGTTAGNENLDGEDILAKVKEIVEGL